jgi:four helix bundle protein
MKNSVLMDKSFDFAIHSVNLYKFLSQEKNEFILSKQLLRSGTSTGALVSEGCYAESKLYFIHKYAIAQKECNETIYWLKLLFKTDYINEKEFESISKDANELMKMITASILTAKKSLKTNITNH